MRIYFSGLITGLFTAAMVLAGGALAEPVNSKVAKRALFRPAGAEVVVVAHGFLTKGDITGLNNLAATYQYYGAFAASPAKGARSMRDMKGAQAAVNYHSLDAARAAALKGCNAARGGGQPCVVIALIRPKGWEKRRIQLGVNATLAFNKRFRRLRKPRAFAISQATGEYAFAKGTNASASALALCNNAAARKGARDCEIVIRD